MRAWSHRAEAAAKAIGRDWPQEGIDSAELVIQEIELRDARIKQLEAAFATWER